MKKEIKSWLTGNVLYSAEAENIKELLMSAIKAGVNLSHADLSGADLSHATLCRANLSGADLSHATLCRANLSHATLCRAGLSDADLYRADLSCTDLSCTDLSGAKLLGANLYRADLSCTDLSCTDLSGAKLLGANLYCAGLSNANLSGAKFSYVLLMSSIQWGSVSNKLCLEMMRRDALITGVEAMSNWAKGGSCPFTSTSETRAYHFYENQRLWRKGKPQMTDRELWVALCKEKNIKI
jgi:hypothetical protein